MIYEERIYKIMPGRVPDIMKRFSHHAVKLFKKHDMQLVGFWSTVVGPSNHELTYILAFQDSNHRDRAWSNFMSDPAWIKAKSESEKRWASGSRCLKPNSCPGSFFTPSVI